MFAGIGGFRSGLSHYGDFFVPVGYCEIDPYAKRAYEAIYEPKGEIYFEDARGIVPESLPDIDLICGGFPCQSFSIAGKRGGFEDARGTLFFEIARIARVKRPRFLLLENVPGLLSHDGCRTFATILGTLDELGYHVAWQVLNSANFGVPQFRKRVLLVGYLGEESGGEILSFTEANPKTIVKRFGGRQGDRVYDGNGLSCTLTSSAGGFAGNTGLYFMDMNNGVNMDRFKLSHFENFGNLFVAESLNLRSYDFGYLQAAGVSRIGIDIFLLPCHCHDGLKNG